MDETQASERIPLQGDRSASHFRNAALVNVRVQRCGRARRGRTVG